MQAGDGAGYSDWGPVLAGVVRRRQAPAMNVDPTRTVTIPLRTWRIIEGRLQTIRARVIETEVELADMDQGQIMLSSRLCLEDHLAVADDDLRVVLDLVREATPSTGGA